MSDGFGFGFGCGDGAIDRYVEVDAGVGGVDLDNLDDVAGFVGPGDLSGFRVSPDLCFEFGGNFHGDVLVGGGESDNGFRLGGGFDAEVVRFGDNRELRDR